MGWTLAALASMRIARWPIGARTVVAERHRARLAAQRRDDVGKRCKLAVGGHHDHAGVVHHARDQTDLVHAVLGLSRHRDEVVAGDVDHADRIGVRRGALVIAANAISPPTRLVQHDELGLGAQSLLDERQQLARHDVVPSSGAKPMTTSIGLSSGHPARLVRKLRPRCCRDECGDLTIHDIPPLFLLLGSRPADGSATDDL